MSRKRWDNRSFRGLLQSGDGIITKVVESNDQRILFQAAFELTDAFVERLKYHAEHLVYSERSRIARLGVTIQGEPPCAERLEGNTLILDLEASSVIGGYPDIKILKDFFTIGLPVGRLVYLNPEALLTSGEVIDAINQATLKLPASTTISSDGSILITPHKVICKLKPGLDKETFGRILFRENGRELLNRFQIREPVPAVTIAPGKGVITTCSMYLNEHYVALQSGLSLGKHLPATILDPIKTRGIRIFLEIVNGSAHPIVNPLISAKIYRVPKKEKRSAPRTSVHGSTLYPFKEMKKLEAAMDCRKGGNCHYLDRPVALIPNKPGALKDAQIFMNGPPARCPVSPAACVTARRDYSLHSQCPHKYGTAHLQKALSGKSGILALKYFPNLLEHRDIINLAADGLISAVYFFEASREHGQFLSEQDHSHLREYQAFGLDTYWICGVNHQLMEHTMRDGMGYFVVPERLADFHKSMLFAFYGSNMILSENGYARLGRLMDTLVEFWGKRIGIVTGGGSGVMEQANTLARERGILSGANYLEITDQSMTTDVDFCQVFQSTCRHSRQKWFEIASFPIFNVGGLGSLEELGITLCNMKLSISEQVPVILFDTESGGLFWTGMETQIREMIHKGRAPEWVGENIVITDDPARVIGAYRNRLNLF
ncbi:MAG: LOG family protein [Desulfobacterales bacterium]|jgi:predicted Rossmann-fold nucleotide-binding protein|nr:LOG family protein [Desulfobacterales bacterium]